MNRSLIIINFFVALFCSTHTSGAQYKLGEFSLESDLYSWYDSAVSVENTVLLRGELFTFLPKMTHSGFVKYFQTGKKSCH